MHLPHIRASTIALTCLLVVLCGCPSAASGDPTPPIVYVSGEGDGDYNCDGVSDQVEINAALDFVAAHSDYTTVHLKGPHTYWIDDTIYISADTTLEGDSDAVIKLIDNAGWWTQFKPLIGQTGLTFTFGLEDPSTTTGNITIRGFEIDGNRQHQSEPSGNSYYNIIRLQNCYNITINDMYLHDNLADAIQTGYDLYGFDINARFYNNRVHNNGHDGIYLGNVENFRVYDNIFTNNRTDAGIRTQYCNHFKIYNNIIGNDPDRQFSGGIGIDIQANGDTPLDDAEIFGNYLYGKGWYNGIWLWHENGGGALDTHQGVHIHHNVISWYQQAGIAIYGFHNTLIEHNVIELNQDGGVVFYRGDPVNNVSGFQTILCDNIIVNNSGYGVDNRQPSIHSFVSDYNCIEGNTDGHYNNASSTTDIHADPLFAHDNAYYYDHYSANTYHILAPRWRAAAMSGEWKGDLGANKAWAVYHLRSEGGRWDGAQWVIDSVTSPCIDSGEPTADHSLEPYPNGRRVNMGAFGGTEHASRSGGLMLVSFGWDMSSNPGWSAEGQWAWGQPTGQGGTEGGNPDPTCGHTGDNVYGVNLNGDYATDVGGPYYLTAGPIDLTGVTDATLKFQRWLNSDTTPNVSATVEVSVDGVKWTTIWSNGETEYYSETEYCTDSSWTECVYGIGSIADGQPHVYVRWGYEVQQAGAVAGSGWNIDDVQIRGVVGGTFQPGYFDYDGDVDFADFKH